MPRIPSASEVNLIGASASRLPSVRAEPEDFGLAAAQGLSRLAIGIENTKPFWERLDEKDEDAEEEASQTTSGEARKPAETGVTDKEASLAKAAFAAGVGRQKAKAREQGRVLIDDMKRGAAAPGLMARDVVQKFDKAQQQALAAVSPGQRRAAEAAIAPVRQGVAVRALRRAHNLEVEGLSGEIAETLDLLKEQATREPAAASLYADEGTAALRSMLATGYLAPEQFEVRNRAFRREVFASAVDAQPAAEMLADLEEGVYDAALGDPELKQFLVEKTGWRLHSETAQGMAAAEAHLRNVRRGEAEPGALGRSTKSLLAAGAMADAELKAEQAYRVRAQMEKLRFAAEADVVHSVEALAPVEGATDAAAREEIQREVWTQSQAMLRERRRDPAAHVMGQPAVAEAFAAAAKNPALLPEAIAARLAAQGAMGLAAEEQNALTLGERAQIVDGLRLLEPRQQIIAMMELGRLYGDHAAAVSADLTDAGVSVEMQLAADPSGGGEVWGALALAADSRDATMAPEGNVIQEAAERLIAEGGETSARQERGAWKDRSAGRLPPPPLRNPRREP
ncbi:MAG: hypothetical protein RLN99_06265, partial [Kiloniellaceae bacterium]